MLPSCMSVVWIIKVCTYRLWRMCKPENDGNKCAGNKQQRNVVFSVRYYVQTTESAVLHRKMQKIEKQYQVGRVTGNTTFFAMPYYVNLKVNFVNFRDQVRILVEGFFTLNQDIPAFKEHLRDFLVQIKVNFVFIICLKGIVLCRVDQGLFEGTMLALAIEGDHHYKSKKMGNST